MKIDANGYSYSELVGYDWSPVYEAQRKISANNDLIDEYNVEIGNNKAYIAQLERLPGILNEVSNIVQRAVDEVNASYAAMVDGISVLPSVGPAPSA